MQSLAFCSYCLVSNERFLNTDMTSLTMPEVASQRSGWLPSVIRQRPFVAETVLKVHGASDCLDAALVRQLRRRRPKGGQRFRRLRSIRCSASTYRQDHCLRHYHSEWLGAWRWPMQDQPKITVRPNPASVADAGKVRIGGESPSFGPVRSPERAKARERPYARLSPSERTPSSSDVGGCRSLRCCSPHQDAFTLTP
jgi:hypothetical protein